VNVPPEALATYEGLRAEVLDGRARPEGLAAIAYHGMLRGLTVIMSEITASPPSLPPREPLSHAAPLDQELLHLIANMVLESQSQLTHVY
jgi:hypothetical protein